jgi:tetratricopeptide (TPR) repeat protein
MHAATPSVIQLQDLIEVEIQRCCFSAEGKLIRQPDSPSVRFLTPTEKAYLQAASYWLNISQKENERPYLEKIQGFLEGVHHLRQLQAWELASQVLFLQSRKEDNLVLYQQLGSLGWFGEQIDCYLDLLGKVSISFDLFCLKELGDAYISLCQYDTAINAFQDLLQLGRQNNNILSEAQALEGLGLCYSYLGNNKAGLELCKKSSLSLKKALNHSLPNQELLQQLAKTLVTASFVAVYIRKYRQARRYARESLAIARQINDSKTEWYALARLATCYSQQGQRKKAFQYIEQQYQKRHYIKDLRQISVMLTCFCVITCSLRKFDLAIDALQEGIQLQKTIGDTNRENHLLSILGYVHLWKNEYQSAISCCQECLGQAKRYGYRGHESIALAQLSYMHSELGNLGYAQKLSKQSLAISRHLEGTFNQAVSLAALSLVYLHRRKIFQGILLIAKSLILVAPPTSGDSKIILVLLIKRLFKSRLHSE